MSRRAPFEAVADQFSYDPATGVISRSGKRVGKRNDQGYTTVRVGESEYRAHRVAWFLSYGRWPTGEIDHINGDRSDNRLANLRDVTPTLNRMNMRRRCDNKSGVTGVFFLRSRRRWTAQICAGGRRQHLGTFVTRDEAVAARLRAQARLGFGPVHGSPRQ